MHSTLGWLWTNLADSWISQGECWQNWVILEPIVTPRHISKIDILSDTNEYWVLLDICFWKHIEYLLTMSLYSLYKSDKNRLLVVAKISTWYTVWHRNQCLLWFKIFLEYIVWWRNNVICKKRYLSTTVCAFKACKILSLDFQALQWSNSWSALNFLSKEYQHVHIPKNWQIWNFWSFSQTGPSKMAKLEHFSNVATLFFCHLYSI